MVRRHSGLDNHQRHGGNVVRRRLEHSRGSNIFVVFAAEVYSTKDHAAHGALQDGRVRHSRGGDAGGGLRCGLVRLLGKGNNSSPRTISSTGTNERRRVSLVNAEEGWNRPAVDGLS